MCLDRFCQFFIVGLLPLIYLPQPGLAVAVSCCLLLAIVTLVLKKWTWAALAFCLLSSYGQVFTLVQRVDQVAPSREQEQIHIRHILKQQDYQTAIGERENGQRIYVNWQSSTPLVLNATYQVALTIRPLSGRLNTGNFDRQKWYLAQGIEQIGTVRSAQRVMDSVSSTRVAWFERVKQHTAGLPSQGVIFALAFGERAWLTPQDWQTFQHTSTAHLIAISGLHIALVFGFGIGVAKGILWCLGYAQCQQAVRFGRFFTYGMGLLLAVGYSYLAGFAIPTLRALLAICLIVLCQGLRRHLTPWQYWWRVVAILLVCDPLTILSDSFWLSILAVASLLCWYRFFPLSAFVGEKCKKWSKSARLCYGLLHLQLGIWLLFSPVQLLFFEGISPFAILANILIVPLYSLVLIPLILLSLISDNLLHTWQLIDKLIQASLAFLEPFATYWLPLSLIQQGYLLALNGLLFVLILVWLRKINWLYGLLPVCIGLSLFIAERWQGEKVEWIHFDVGQGLAMAFFYSSPQGKKAILYDTGASWQGSSMAQLEILPYLQRQGVEVVAIFVSHSDNDHAGGVPLLLQHYPNARLILSQTQNWGHPLSEPCTAGKQWQFGKLHMQAIYPSQLVARAENQHSCVVLVSIGQHRLLLTGDSGIQQERIFAKQVGKLDVLQVGHHGSNTSSSHTLLAHTQPDVAIISAGRWNPWQLPSQRVEKRLEQYHIRHFNTAKTGMVKVTFYPDAYQVQTARDETTPWYRGYLGQNVGNWQKIAQN